MPSSSRRREPGQAKGTHTGKVFYALNCVFEENAAYEAIVKSVVYVKPKWFPGKIGVNQMGAVGLYKTGYKSSCHCHVLPVKNLMLSGMKAWKFWAPGTFAKLNPLKPAAPPATPPAVCIAQEEGDVLWIPPGWLHLVDTIQEGPLRDPNSVSVASAYATWAFPMTFRALALARWTTGLSVEHQAGGKPCPDMKAATSRDYLRLFGAIPPTETLPDPTTTPAVYPPANGLATRPAL